MNLTLALQVPGARASLYQDSKSKLRSSFFKIATGNSARTCLAGWAVEGLETFRRRTCGVSGPTVVSSAAPIEADCNDPIHAKRRCSCGRPFS